MSKSSVRPCKLRSIFYESLHNLVPEAWVHEKFPRGRISDDHAILCWGKAAVDTWQALQREGHASICRTALVISPRGSKSTLRDSPRNCRIVEGEHPLPGSGSLEAGGALIDFFDSLKRFEVKRLWVFLSGGASSLAWLPPADLSPSELHQKLQTLYQQPLSIQQLNHERARLCALKQGGAATWLKRLFPTVRISVHLVSDVWPFGPQTVGSGPFWDGMIRHETLVDHKSLMKEIQRISLKHEVSFLGSHSLSPCDVSRWVENIRSAVLSEVGKDGSGVLAFGGEPKLRLSPRAIGKGGRMTHLAALIASSAAMRSLLLGGKIEVLCMSTDGVDGNSGAAGVWLGTNVSHSSMGLRELKRSLSEFDTASPLRRAGALMPSGPTGTNVQDVVLVRILK